MCIYSYAEVRQKVGQGALLTQIRKLLQVVSVQEQVMAVV